MNGRGSNESRRRKVSNERSGSTATETETATQIPSGESKRRRILVLRGRQANGIMLFLLVILVFSTSVFKRQSQLIQSSHTSALDVSLRRDWTSFTRLSALAQRYKDLQSDCAAGEALNPFSALGLGLGSELHTWTQRLCESYSNNLRIRSTLFKDTWTWLDQESCNQTEARLISPLYCYFPSAEGQCRATKNAPSARCSRTCEVLKADLNLTTADVRTAGIEFLFSNVSPIIIAEAKRQARLVFGGKPVPKNLVTVHVRWGDKVMSREMSFIPIEDYIDAVATVAKQRNNNGKVSVYLATEDPKAVQQFQDKAPPEWNVYVDQYFHESRKYRQVDKELRNQAVATSKETKGRAGLLTLASLLVAMESNDYVLTTASNWSRLMNELRTAMLDVECQNCTRMIDLQKPSQVLQV